MRNFLKNSCLYFLGNFGTDLDEIQAVATTTWFVEAHAKYILHK